MESIPKTDCDKVGFFKKTHGVFGELVLEYEPQYEYSIENADRFFVELEGFLVPFFVLEDMLKCKYFLWIQLEKTPQCLLSSPITAWTAKP